MQNFSGTLQKHNTVLNSPESWNIDCEGVFPCLTDPSNASPLNAVILIKVRMNCCLHGNITLGV